MPDNKKLVSKTFRIRVDQLNRLSLLQQALQEKMNKEYSLNDLLQVIIDEFLNK